GIRDPLVTGVQTCALPILTKSKKIKVSLGFAKTLDAALVARLNAVHDGMSGNPAYPSPPLDLATFKTAIDSFAASIAEALDGGRSEERRVGKERAEGSWSE